MTSELSFIHQLEHLSRDYYDRNKNRLISIVLAGSVACGLQTVGSGDIDVVLICRYYDLSIAKHFSNYLENFVDGLEVDAGVYPLSRIKREKSILMCDIKSTGKVLAGKDIRPLIVEITPEDLFPYEAFRLLLNRSAELVMSVVDVTSNGVYLHPCLYPRASCRIIRAYIDSFLIFNMKYTADPIEKRRLFLSFCGSIPKVETFGDCKKTLLAALQYGLKKAEFNTFDEMLQAMKAKYKYSWLFRIYTAFKTKKFSAALNNPIFEAYRRVYSFLESGETESKDWRIFICDIRRVWESSPQPIVIQ